MSDTTATKMESPTEAPNRLRLSTQNQTLSEYFEDYFRRLRSGDLGQLPIIIGLIVIAAIFQSQNDNYLTARNFVQLILQMAGITTIAYGIVFVLLIGEIDLSVSYISAVAGISMSVLLVDYSFPWYAALLAAVALSAGIGLLQGSIITLFQVPPFVVTLAGFLVWNGVALRIIGDGGNISIREYSQIIDIANYRLPANTGIALGVIFVLLVGLSSAYTYWIRQNSGLGNKPIPIIAAQWAILAIITYLVISISNQSSGFPFVGVLLIVMMVVLTYITDNTQFGRYVYAVGGNIEAARRAGIRVGLIRTMVFMLAGLMAGIGGVILAARLRSVDPGAGGGDLLLNSIAAAVIGGTSLYGGRGFIASAIFGALIIASVENGMGLLNLSSGNKFIITGIVLLIAVVVDSLSRRRQKQSGIA